MKIKFLCQTSHISSVEKSHMTSGYHISLYTEYFHQHRKVLWDSTFPDGCDSVANLLSKLWHRHLFLAPQGNNEKLQFISEKERCLVKLNIKM